MYVCVNSRSETYRPSPSPLFSLSMWIPCNPPFWPVMTQYNSDETGSYLQKHLRYVIYHRNVILPTVISTQWHFNSLCLYRDTVLSVCSAVIGVLAEKTSSQHSTL